MITYGGQILEHYRHPRNAGSLSDPDISYEDVNPLCGDRIRIMLKLAAGETVEAARFRADGCIISQAASSFSPRWSPAGGSMKSKRLLLKRCCRRSNRSFGPRGSNAPSSPMRSFKPESKNTAENTDEPRRRTIEERLSPP
ncbi:MAG: iron-sulfur cluster assembly scaffold protein [Candidatus Manganitrophus sp.]|nr:MAG: iron-sulfur cluster assembly scaffold protein [Candidatus Manganitrophus sp.]